MLRCHGHIYIHIVNARPHQYSHGFMHVFSALTIDEIHDDKINMYKIYPDIISH